MNKMAHIGFTTGCLYRSGLSIKKQIHLFHEIGANAIELSSSTPAELISLELSMKSMEDIKNYDFISFHAPWREVKYDRNIDTENIINQLRYWCELLPVDGIVLHPSTIDDYSKLERYNLPFLLENMDKGKKFGTRPEHFEKLKRDYNFGFVFDAQHAYEHDSSMELGKELIEVIGDRLHHIHVSGCTKDEKHFPTYMANNKDAIVKILDFGINVPKILEGIVLDNILQTASKEFAFIKRYEK